MAFALILNGFEQGWAKLKTDWTCEYFVSNFVTGREEKTRHLHGKIGIQILRKLKLHNEGTIYHIDK